MFLTFAAFLFPSAEVFVQVPLSNLEFSSFFYQVDLGVQSVLLAGRHF